MEEKRHEWDIRVNDYSPHGVCVIHVEVDHEGKPFDWTFVYCNAVLAEMEGYPKEELTGKRFFDLFPDGNRKWLDYYYAAAYEHTYQEFDEISEEIGLYLHIEAIPTDQEGCCLCILRDVKADVFAKIKKNQELQAALNKLEEEQRILEQLLEEARLKNEIISSISKSYRSIYRIDIRKDFFEEISNDDETHRLTGYRGCASEKLYQICDTLIEPEFRSVIRPFMDISTLPERLKNEEFVSTEYRMCDGSWQKLRFIVKKRDEAGNVTHVLCTIRSISDSKRQELNLVFTADSAKREAKMKTRFLASMSHDIRTPLNGVIGMLQLAEQYADDAEVQKKIRCKAMESLKYLVSLVNDILDMNKLQSGELRQQEMNFDLVDMLQRVNQKFAARALEKGIDYKVGWGPTSITKPFLIGNPVYLERVLSNIADNAVKFSREGSTIKVWLDEKPMEGNCVELTFYCEDYGIGMSEDFIRHAFDMFSQEKETSRTTYEGSGLGLAITKEMVERMGGSIDLQSKLGEGTTVRMTFPFRIGSQDAIDTIDRKIDLERVPVNGIRALVAEDNALNMEIARAMLEHNGIEVTCAGDGQEALEIYEASAPGYFGVIYMDLMMPRMNGMDAARAIRALPRVDAKNVGIIAISANAFAEDVIGSRLAGMDVHLAKPLDEKEMIRALRQCMARNTDETYLHDD